MRIRNLVCAVLAVVSLCVLSCFAGSKIAPDLDLSKTESVGIIVQYSTKPSARHSARVNSLGGRLNYRWEMINADHYSLSGAGIRQLANDPEVVAIHPDRVVKGSLDLTAAATNAPAAWASG